MSGNWRTFETKDPLDVLLSREAATCKGCGFRKLDPFGSIATVCAKGLVIGRKCSSYFESLMTKDESDDIEELLDLWVRWSGLYAPVRGYASETTIRRGHPPLSGATQDDDDDTDDTTFRNRGEQIDACIESLSVKHQLSMFARRRNTQAVDSPAVWRNPRVPIEQQHAAYQDAKECLFPLLRRRELLRQRCK